MCGGSVCDVPGPWLHTRRFARYLDESPHKACLRQQDNQCER